MYLENNQVKIYPVKAALAWLLVLLWMALIFVLSHQTSEESGQISHNLAVQVLRIVRDNPSDSMIAAFENNLRTAAHGASFFVLAILTSLAFAQVKVREIGNAFLTLILCLIYAASDELHQAFIPGRAATVFDFLVDGGGIILGILAYQVTSTIRFLRQELQVDRQEELHL